MNHTIPATVLANGSVVRIVDVFSALNTAMESISQVARSLDWHDEEQRVMVRSLFDALSQQHMCYMTLMDLSNDAYDVFNDLVEVRF